jgi:hypothetical protein
MTSVLFLGIYNLINSINKDYKTKYEVVVSCNLISNNGFFEFLRKKNIKVEITCIGITYLIEAIRYYRFNLENMMSVYIFKTVVMVQYISL